MTVCWAPPFLYFDRLFLINIKKTTAIRIPELALTSVPHLHSETNEGPFLKFLTTLTGKSIPCQIRLCKSNVNIVLQIRKRLLEFFCFELNFLR